MNVEPQKFFIGLIDFFSILLPGALLTYMLKNDAGPLLLGDNYETLGEVEAWTVFLFASYLLGHFSFLLGSWKLDDEVYDRLRKATFAEQVKILKKKDGALSPHWIRLLAKHLFSYKHVDTSLNQVLRIKKHYLNPLGASSAINAFQWAKARLTIEKPNALEVVQRFEADSKFFRSLVVVLLILILWNVIKCTKIGGISKCHWDIVLVSLTLLLPTLWRYINQRMKAVRQAYWFIITLEASNVTGYRKSRVCRKDGLTHAGGVVFREKNGQPEYLLVQAKNKPEDWVLPKGHIELGESMKETAVREVREESGVWARVIKKLGTYSYKKDEKTINTQVFLMETLEEGQSFEGRQLKWLPLKEAQEVAKHSGTKSILEEIQRES